MNTTGAVVAEAEKMLMFTKFFTSVETSPPCRMLPAEDVPVIAVAPTLAVTLVLYVPPLFAPVPVPREVMYVPGLTPVPDNIIPTVKRDVEPWVVSVNRFVPVIVPDVFVHVVVVVSVTA